MSPPSLPVVPRLHKLDDCLVSKSWDGAVGRDTTERHEDFSLQLFNFIRRRGWKAFVAHSFDHGVKFIVIKATSTFTFRPGWTVASEEIGAVGRAMFTHHSLRRKGRGTGAPSKLGCRCQRHNRIAPSLS